MLAPQVTYFVNSPEELERVEVDEMDDDDDGGNAKVAPAVVARCIILVRVVRVWLFVHSS